MGWKGGLGACVAIVVAVAIYVFACALSIAKLFSGMQGAGYSANGNMTFPTFVAVALGLFKRGRFWIPFVQEVPLA